MNKKYLSLLVIIPLLGIPGGYLYELSLTNFSMTSPAIEFSYTCLGGNFTTQLITVSTITPNNLNTGSFVIFDEINVNGTVKENNLFINEINFTSTSFSMQGLAVVTSPDLICNSPTQAVPITISGKCNHSSIINSDFVISTPFSLYNGTTLDFYDVSCI